MTNVRRVLVVALLGMHAGCSGSNEGSRALVLATTTSTRDSGLLDVLVPRFERQSGVEVKVVAVGSGQALELGRRGDADVLLSHAPEAEEDFVAEGYGTERRRIMHNEFVLLGPDEDPAGARDSKSVVDAFGRIARTESPFVSRGDDSGTHRKELEIWHEAGIDPGGAWHLDAGAGMAEVLRMADQKRAYTLADRGTFLSHRGNLDLRVALEPDSLLANPYSVILVSPTRHPHVNHEAARKFAEFLLSAEVQRSIGEFGVEELGEPLFIPVSSSAGQDR